MGKTNMNIRMDNEVKKQAQKLFAHFGLDMTTAINMFLRQAIREQSIPFKLTLNTPNEETLIAMKEINEGKNLKGPFTSIEALMEDLNAED